MEMKLSSETIKSERQKRAWSQQHLAEVAGLGVRTVQRIEATGLASYESAAAIAAGLQVEVEDLTTMNREASGFGRTKQSLLGVVKLPASEVLDAYRFRGSLHRIPFLFFAVFLLVLFPYIQKLLMGGWIESGRSLVEIVPVLHAIHWAPYILLVPLCASRLRNIGWPQSLSALALLPPVAGCVFSSRFFGVNDLVTTPPIWASNVAGLAHLVLFVFLLVLARYRGAS